MAADAVLGFMQLMWAVDHELQRVSKRMRVAVGLTGPQRLALLVIGRNRGATAGELAALLHLHPSTLTGILRRLEDGGFVARAADAADRRRVRLVLTRRGEKADRVRQGTVESAVRRTLAALAPKDRQAAQRVLSQLVAELRSGTDVERR